MKRTCLTHKQAQFICINQSCKQKCSYVCSLPNDQCKQQHESCSLISLNYVIKKCTKIISRERTLNMKELQSVYDKSKKMTQKLEGFFQEREIALKVKDIIDPHGLFQMEEKTQLITFARGYQKRQSESPQQSTLSAAWLEKELMALNLQINSYLKYLKDSTSTDQGQLKSQNRITINKRESERKQGSAIDKIRSQSKGPTPVRSANTMDFDTSPQKSSKINKIQSPGMTNSSAFQMKLNSVIKGHQPVGPLFSNITNNIQTLQSFFYQKFKGGNLLYRASQNDFLVSKFHQKCDGKHNTLTLLITEYDKIIGGFTPLPWRTNGDWFSDDTESSFIFSLSMGERFPIQGKSKAIWCNHAYGPSFGYPDLQIANKAFYNQNSCVNFPQFYNNGNYSNGPASIELFCGTKTGHFRIKEWQVYQLQF